MKIKEKPFQFLKLCILLTKQGFKFTRDGNSYKLIFDSVDLKRLFHYQTKLPFVNSISIKYYNRSKSMVDFKQWSEE